MSAAEIYKLAADLSQVGARSVPAVRGVMQEVGDAFARDWASNARETAGEHGKHYPGTISAELAFSVRSIAVEAGPETHKKQGGMGYGFEMGSQNQPAHLDGLRALDGIRPRLERMLDATVGHLFG